MVPMHRERFLDASHRADTESKRIAHEDRPGPMRLEIGSRDLCPNGAAGRGGCAHNHPSVRAKEKRLKAADVRVLRALDPGESYVEPVFLLVETARGDEGEPVTTIDQI